MKRTSTVALLLLFAYAIPLLSCSQDDDGKKEIGFSEHINSPVTQVGDKVLATHLLEDSSGNIYWAIGGRGHLYRSTDGGVTFSQHVNPQVGGAHSTHLLEDSSGNIYWAFATGPDKKAYLYRSTDGGETFSEHTNSPVSAGHRVNDTYLLEDSSGGIYWAFVSTDYNSYLYRSTDGGATFSEHPNSPVTTGGFVHDTHLLEDSSGNIYWAFGSYDRKAYLYRSTDGGETFSEHTNYPITTELAIRTQTLHLLEDSSGNIYWTFGSINGKAYLYRSTDGGETFSEHTNSPVTTNKLIFIVTSHGDSPPFLTTNPHLFRDINVSLPQFTLFWLAPPAFRGI